mgnify:CR=1 FL=1
MQCKEYNIYLIDVLACLLYLSVEATLALAYALPWFFSIYFVVEMIREWARQLSQFWRHKWKKIILLTIAILSHFKKTDPCSLSGTRTCHDRIIWNVCLKMSSALRIWCFPREIQIWKGSDCHPSDQVLIYLMVIYYSLILNKPISIAARF